MADGGFAVFGGYDGNDVESAGVVVKPISVYELPGGGDEVFLFAVIDSRLGGGELFTAAGFYFHKDDCIVIPHNKVDLAAGGIVIAPQQPIALFFEELTGELFTIAAQFDFIGGMMEKLTSHGAYYGADHEEVALYCLFVTF